MYLRTAGEFLIVIFKDIIGIVENKMVDKFKSFIVISKKNNDDGKANYHVKCAVQK